MAIKKAILYFFSLLILTLSLGYYPDTSGDSSISMIKAKSSKAIVLLFEDEDIFEEEIGSEKASSFLDILGFWGLGFLKDPNLNRFGQQFLHTKSAPIILHIPLFLNCSCLLI